MVGQGVVHRGEVLVKTHSLRALPPRTKKKPNKNYNDPPKSAGFGFIISLLVTKIQLKQRSAEGFRSPNTKSLSTATFGPNCKSDVRIAT
jgi:hypothetical protein